MPDSIEFTLNTNGRGPRGYSAYQVAVSNGFEGTEPEWLESLEASVTNSNVNAAIEADAEATREALDLTSGNVQQIAAQVLTAGTNVSAPRIDVDGVNGTGRFLASNVTELRDYEVPDASGTLALTSDITAEAVGLDEVDNTPDTGKPVSTAQQAALDLKADLSDHPVNGSVALSTPKAFAKAIAGTAPIRYAVLGDSMATGFDLSPTMGKRGFIGLTVPASLKTGTVTDTVDFASWINGEFQRFAASSSGEFVPNGLTGYTGYTQGDVAAIAYIARPGAGTFRLRSKASDGTLATLAASIDATKDGSGNTVSVPTGVVKTYSLATSNWPAFRLVVDSVTGGDVDIIFGAIYPSTGGGVIETRILMASRGGLELTDSLQTSTAILNPIWEWLAPDVVFSLWADEGSNWESGGNWRTYYSRLKTAYANSDFVQISRNPSSGEDAIATAQVAAQKAWALETNEAFIDVQSLVGGTYAAANAKGWMGDTVHLNTTGTAHRNAHIWNQLPLGKLQLGAWGPDRAFRALAEPSATPAYTATSQLAFPLGLRIPDSDAAVPSAYWDVTSTAKIISWKRGSTTYYTLSGTQDGLAGFYPGFDGLYLGSSSLRWRTFATQISAATATKTTTYAATANDHTLLCDATAGAFDIDLPAAASNSGRILVIKKIDSSGNAVSIDPNSTELIDGSSTSVAISTQWQSLTIQSNGTSWFIIGKYTP